MSFAVKGVIEGFYGRLWPWPVRERFCREIGRLGFNVYAYAPKEDRLQNAGWRTPYPQARRRRLAAFAELCRSIGVEPWFGLRPVGISYADERDLALVIAKLRDYLALGAQRLLLLADDIPSRLDPSRAGRFDDLAEAHAWLVNEVRHELAGSRLVFVPTDYHGAGSPYLRQLAAAVPGDVELVWTGPAVCSRSITVDDARAIGDVLRRPPLIWDNYPVNDGPMRDELHIGPIRDRDAQLHRWTSGILVNPALEAEASLVPLATWAEYLDDPAGYDPDAAWQRALRRVTGNLADAGAVARLAVRLDRSVIDQPWRREPAAADFDEPAPDLGRLANRRLAGDLRRWGGTQPDLPG